MTFAAAKKNFSRTLQNSSTLANLFQQMSFADFSRIASTVLVNFAAPRVGEGESTNSGARAIRLSSFVNLRTNKILRRVFEKKDGEVFSFASSPIYAAAQKGGKLLELLQDVRQCDSASLISSNFLLAFSSCCLKVQQKVSVNEAKTGEMENR